MQTVSTADNLYVIDPIFWENTKQSQNVGC